MEWERSKIRGTMVSGRVLGRSRMLLRSVGRKFESFAGV